MPDEPRSVQFATINPYNSLYDVATALAGEYQVLE